MGAARLEEADRNLPAANALLDRAEAVDATNPSVMLLRAVVLGRMRDAPAALAQLARIEAGIWERPKPKAPMDDTMFQSENCTA